MSKAAAHRLGAGRAVDDDVVRLGHRQAGCERLVREGVWSRLRGEVGILRADTLTAVMKRTMWPRLGVFGVSKHASAREKASMANEAGGDARVYVINRYE